MKEAIKINLAEKFAIFNDHYSPKIIGDLNENFIKLVKFQGEFVWHDHKDEDELFIVIKGELIIKFCDKIIEENNKENINLYKKVLENIKELNDFMEQADKKAESFVKKYPYLKSLLKRV